MRVHFNVTGDRRKALVKIVADTTGAKPEYMGMPTASYQIGSFTVTKDGTLECSDHSGSEEVKAVLDALRAAGFEGIGETVLEPEKPQEMPAGAGAESQVTERSAEDNNQHDSVEVTFTLPMARHNGTSLRNLINLLYTRASLLNKALGTAFRVDEGLVRVLQNEACVLTLDRLFETVEAYESHSSKAINGLRIQPDKLTFSTLPQTDDPAVLQTFTILCAMMNRQALTHQRIRAKEVNNENEKYAMRIWLLRLGMNGPEYREERRILMQNLTGHSAFRTEEGEERWQKKQNEKRDALRALKKRGSGEDVITSEVSQ